MNSLRSTTYIALATTLSRILGFVRDMVIAWIFGASWQIDAFFAAFRIPNLVRRLVAEGTLSLPLVSVIMSYRQKEERKQMAQRLFSVYFIAGVFISIAGIFAAPFIAGILGFGFSADVLDLSVVLLRMMFVYCLCASIVAFAMGILNTSGIFFIPALSPLLLNVGIILFCYFAYMYSNVMWLAAGVVAGGVMQCLTVVFPLSKTGVRLRIQSVEKNIYFDMSRMVVSSVMGVAVYHVNVLVNTMMASTLQQGSVSYLYYADRFIEIVSGVFIISMSNAYHPEISHLWAQQKIDQLQSTITKILQASLFIAFPASAGLIATGRIILATFFEHGNFYSYETAMTYTALAYAAVGIPAFAVVRIIMPLFISMRASTFINKISISAVALNIVVGFVLMRTSLMHGGLALANSISLFFVAIALIIKLMHTMKVAVSKNFMTSLLQYCGAAVVMGVVLYAVQWFFGYQKGIVYTFVLVALGVVLYVSMCRIMNPAMQLRILLESIRKDR
ncbi:MAG: murein biosynthesis integral membrane protein MurJ [Spirochaetes bacterium]|nr:murein biosynthesis integral membrane protein MurJ [Spirochaetota bacterium]